MSGPGIFLLNKMFHTASHPGKSSSVRLVCHVGIITHNLTKLAYDNIHSVCSLNPKRTVEIHQRHTGIMSHTRNKESVHIFT